MADAAAAHSSTKRYVVIWGWLAGLMLLGVALSELPIPKVQIVLIVLGLSTIKAVLVGMYYMHLKIDARLLRLVAIGPLGLILLSLSVVFASRFIHF